MMYYAINGGSVSFGENTILSDIHFEVHTGEKIAVVGRNGCGKTTLLKAVLGEYEIEGGEVVKDECLEIGTLSQIAFEDDSLTMGEELLKAFEKINRTQAELDRLCEDMEKEPTAEKAERYASLTEQFRNLGGYYYQRDYESIIKSFGFSQEDKQKPLSQFSGGQRTKIAFMKLLLSKPELLLLDEPTNHLDINAVEWLESYIKSYPNAVVIVSHDRMFLDRTVGTVYEIERGKMRKYVGNYSKFVKIKQELFEKQQKEYFAQQKEIERIEAVVEKFRYKKNKAKMAQSKIKYLERMDIIEPPERFDLRAFYTDTTPVSESGGDVLSVQNLGIGYGKILSTVNLSLKKQCKVGIIGGNGLGKSTFLKTLMGDVAPLFGSFHFGVNVIKGYFDQQMAEHTSEKTVFDDYADTFPNLTNIEARSDLGAFLFSGDAVFKKVSVLSGGERVRLALCKLFKKHPNFLLLDEPTNHTDIVGKEALGNMLKEYKGSLICVSHDRYFLAQVCDSLLVFGEDGKAEFMPCDFETYERNKKGVLPDVKPEEKTAEPKKQKNISPLKEMNKLKIKIGHTEEKIAIAEQNIEGIKEEMGFSENQSDYEKLSELGKALEDAEIEYDILLGEWDALTTRLAQLEAEN